MSFLFDEDNTNKDFKLYANQILISSAIHLVLYDIGIIKKKGFVYMIK